LSHASDLDIVYLFTGDYAAESDGRRPLGATLYFNRLAQRISAALSVPTAEGALYEVDTRLRPQGTQGPLASSLDSFALYQRDQAWVWEHMALCRARPLFGSAPARDALAGIITQVLTAPPPEDLTAQILTMRSRMADHKPPKGPLDVKLMRGGLVDVEFVIHTLQLTHGIALNPRLDAALAELIAAGHLAPAMADAYAVMARLLIASRLIAPDGAVPGDAACAALAKACGLGDWQAVLAALTHARAQTGAAWHHLFGVTLEIQAHG
jgi:glutamate-ammonia-ligase adenylyltransferase